jgi:RNA polymerase sigma factor (sigma-70 family)
MSQQEEWFESHVRPHEPLLRAWLSGRFPEIRDVDDIVQESYMRLLQSHGRVQISEPKAYLFRIAKNLVMDRIRHDRVVAFEPLVESGASNVLDGSESVQQTVTRDQQLELMTEAIQTLPTQCRQIFTLRKVYGLSQQEIAARMGLSVHTVSAQLTIGLHKCKDYVARRIGPLD